MGAPTSHTQAQVLAAVEKGITKVGTATVLKCSWSTVHRYEKRWKAVHDALIQKRTELVDLAEMGLRGAVLKQEPWAVTFALRTLARDIYADRTEITGSDGGDIRVSVTDARQLLSTRIAIIARRSREELAPGEPAGESGEAAPLGLDRLLGPPGPTTAAG